MERLESILFSYNNKDRLVYQLYAEFLRLMGVYVCEDILYDQEHENKDWHMSDFSIHYIIDDSDRWEQADYGMEERLSAFKVRLGMLLQDEDFFECYDVVLGVFVKNRLLQASTVLQYFKLKKDEILEAGERFEHAADSLTELLKNHAELYKNRYARYANLYCKQKANSSRYIYKKSLIYYVDKLAGQGLRLIEDFKDFSNAWVLLGLICEKSRDYFRETLDAYQRAISAVADKPFVSNIYYWLGKCLEGEDKYICSRAKKEYQMAYQTLKKYRNIYKMAVPYKDEGKWDEANQYFLECIQLLENKKGYLDPLEQEYYFKVNVMISYCNLKNGQYLDTIRHAKKALELKRALENGLEKDNVEIKFYRSLYGEEAEKFIRLAIGRMGELQIYRYLTVAYFQMQMSEEGEAALRQVEKLERA